MARPAIGICTAQIEASWGLWTLPAALLPLNYIDAIQAAGGLALMIPPDPALAENPDQLLATLDGLILAGGNDLDPATYGAEPHPATAGLVPARDATELALARRAVALDLPVLGVCRGMQVLNVALGGTLLQHLPDVVGHEEHRRVPGSFTGSDHDVTLNSGSLAARAAGEETHGTKSHHHQAVDVIGSGLQITGYSTIDELPETVEAAGKRFVLGVQWHPEADERSRVIAALVNAARDYRTARGSS
ncbi:MAG: gamma-glutamyl-gamma-aminobutyrate hydrolase family protein [Solirubrobacteraceae bacterium]